MDSDQMLQELFISTIIQSCHIIKSHHNIWHQGNLLIDLEISPSAYLVDMTVPKASSTALEEWFSLGIKLMLSLYLFISSYIIVFIAGSASERLIT